MMRDALEALRPSSRAGVREYGSPDGRRRAPGRGWSGFSHSPSSLRLQAPLSSALAAQCMKWIARGRRTSSHFSWQVVPTFRYSSCSPLSEVSSSALLPISTPQVDRHGKSRQSKPVNTGPTSSPSFAIVHKQTLEKRVPVSLLSGRTQQIIFLAYNGWPRRHGRQ